MMSPVMECPLRLSSSSSNSQEIQLSTQVRFSLNKLKIAAGIYTNGATAVYNTCNFTSNTGGEVIRAVTSSVSAQTLYIFNNNAAAINCTQSSFIFYDPHIWGNHPDFPCPSDQCSFVVASPNQLGRFLLIIFLTVI